MPVLHKTLPYDPLDRKALPGIQPLDPDQWLIADEAFAGQMAERDRLLRERRAEVLAMDEDARPAAEELLDLVLERYLPPTDAVRRADGVVLPVDRGDPLGTLGRLVQEDLCLMEKRGDAHVLTGAVLCFPASWSLDEKFMRPLIGIHEPVEEYDEGIAARVQRLFDGIQVGRPLWRFNALWYDDPALFQPRRADQRREEPDTSDAGYLRSERQCLLRLPRTRAVVFSIHTYVLARADVPGSQRQV